MPHIQLSWFVHAVSFFRAFARGTRRGHHDSPTPPSNNVQFPQTALLHSGAHLVAYERRDPRTRGLILRVEPSGRKSLYFEHAGGKRAKP